MKKRFWSTELSFFCSSKCGRNVCGGDEGLGEREGTGACVKGEVQGRNIQQRI